MSLRTVHKIYGFIWTELLIKEELITRVEEIGKEDKQPMMENEPIFEWSPGKIILDEQGEVEDFDNLINDVHHHHNYDNDSNCVINNSYRDDDRLGSWVA